MKIFKSLDTIDFMENELKYVKNVFNNNSNFASKIKVTHIRVALFI